MLLVASGCQLQEQYWLWHWNNIDSSLLAARETCITFFHAHTHAHTSHVLTPPMLLTFSLSYRLTRFHDSLLSGENPNFAPL